MPASMRSWGAGHFAPWSQVSDRRSCAGRVVTAEAIASRTASAPGRRARGHSCTGDRCRGPPSGQVQLHREPGRALDQGADRRNVQPHDQVASQCPGTARSAASAGRWLIRISGVTNFLPRPRVRARGTRSARPCAGTPSARAAARRGPGHKGLVDRLVGGPHALIIRQVGPQPVRDLLRAPRPGPARSARRPCRRPIQRTSGPGTATPPGLVIAPESRSCTYSRKAWFSASFAILGGVPADQRAMSGHGPYSSRPPRLQRSGAAPARSSTATGRYAWHLPDTAPPDPQDRDLLPLRERQIPPRQRRQADRPDPAAVTEPPRTNCRRHTSLKDASSLDIPLAIAAQNPTPRT